jgi:hypothetical protein
MRYYPRLKLYKAMNVTFDPVTMDARSYKWWRFVKPIGSNLVFNHYRYSVTTSIHQREVIQVLESLGVEYKSMLVVHSVKSLDDKDWIKDCLARYEAERAALLAEVKKPRSQLRRNVIRISRATELLHKMKLIRRLNAESN